MKTVQRVWEWATVRLAEAGIENARKEAEWLLLRAWGRAEHESALLLGRVPFPTAAEAVLREWVQRRARSEPLQYILGTAFFRDMELAVGPGVLVPRPETETLVDLALGTWPGHGRVCDLCTGSGCVALGLARELPGAPAVVGVDISEPALGYAARNRERLGVRNLDLVQADLLSWVCPGARFQLITANPPYVSAREYAELPTDVREFEPVQALVADDDGLAVLERLAGSALAVLAPGGRLYCEIGETQGRRALALFNGLGLERVTVHPDLSGRDRVVSGRRPA